MTSPASYASTTSWARSRARVFTIALLTCVFAVAGLITIRSAISSLAGFVTRSTAGLSIDSG